MILKSNTVKAYLGELCDSANKLRNGNIQISKSTSMPFPQDATTWIHSVQLYLEEKEFQLELVEYGIMKTILPKFRFMAEFRSTLP